MNPLGGASARVDAWRRLVAVVSRAPLAGLADGRAGGRTRCSSCIARTGKPPQIWSRRSVPSLPECVARPTRAAGRGRARRAASAVRRLAGRPESSRTGTSRRPGGSVRVRRRRPLPSGLTVRRSITSSKRSPGHFDEVWRRRVDDLSVAPRDDMERGRIGLAASANRRWAVKPAVALLGARRGPRARGSLATRARMALLPARAFLAGGPTHTRRRGKRRSGAVWKCDRRDGPRAAEALSVRGPGSRLRTGDDAHAHAAFEEGGSFTSRRAAERFRGSRAVALGLSAIAHQRSVAPARKRVSLTRLRSRSGAAS